MDNDRKFQRLAGWTAIVSAPLGYASLVLGLAAASFNFEAMTDPSVGVRELAASGRGNLFGWSFVFDVFGFYLLLVPLALFLWRWLRPRSPSLIDLFTLSGLGYLLFGAMGAAIIVAVTPGIVDAYAQATGAARQLQEALFVNFFDAVQKGVWMLLNGVLSGVWWVGIGAFLRHERRALGWVTIVLGAAVLLAFIGGVVDVEAIVMPAIVAVVLAPAWAAWTGVVLLRMPATSAT